MFLKPTTIFLIFPEIFLFASTIILFIYAIFVQSKKINITKDIAYLTLAILSITIMLYLNSVFGNYHNMVIQDTYTTYTKIIILFLSLIVIFFSLRYLERVNILIFEYFFLILFATNALLLLISSFDFLLFILALELQSMCLYGLALLYRKSVITLEAGVKYFFLGVLSSGFFFIGMFILYFYTGTIQFDKLALFFAMESDIDFGDFLVIEFPGFLGMFFILISIFFKIGVAPFHNWSPDVYDGTALPTTAYFAVVIKFAMISVLFKILSIPFSSLVELWQIILVVVSAISLLIGSFSAANNMKVKRFLAYSSIAHVGFILNALSTIDSLSLTVSIFYLIVYIFLSLGIWTALLLLEVGHLNKTPHIKYLTDLSGFAKQNKTIAALIAVLLFSMSGIPPLAGFYSKFFVLVNTLEHSLIGLFAISLFASAIGAFYYLRALKIIYFDQLNTKIFFNKVEFYNSYVFAIIIGINILFSMFPGPVFKTAFSIGISLLV